MITTPADYLSLLYLIQDQNRQTIAITLPKDEKIYNIDLNSRAVEAPEFLSVEYDHNAETIYYRMQKGTGITGCRLSGKLFRTFLCLS